jgi:hypothetical protein
VDLQEHPHRRPASPPISKAQTGIDVKLEAFTPDDVFTSKIQSAAQTGDLPDVLELHAGGEDLRVGGAGLLGDLAADFPESARQRFLPNTRAAGLVTEQRRAEQEEVKDGTRGQGLAPWTRSHAGDEAQRLTATPTQAGIPFARSSSAGSVNPSGSGRQNGG